MARPDDFADVPVERFLRVLHLPRREPSRAFLRQLVAAYVTRVPFENVSKLFRFVRQGLAGVPDAETFLDGLEHLGFGGTCYANNYHLYRLLGALGFDVALCGADMRAPDVHAVVMAEVEGHEYLLDAGYAAPFLEPLPRDLAHDHEVALGGDRYVLRPRDAAGRSRLELHRGGALAHVYLAKPEPKRLDDFTGPIADSYRPGATFMKALLLTRFRPGAGLSIRNLTLVESHGLAWSSRTLRDRAELLAEIQARFGIPGEIVTEVLVLLGELGDPWS